MTKLPIMKNHLASMLDALRSIPRENLPPSVTVALLELHAAAPPLEAASARFDAAMVRLEEVLAEHGLVLDDEEDA